MREIKFRAWDKNTKSMIKGGSFFDVSQTQGVDRWVFGMDIFNHPDDVELMQFTGLKDKNGVEIYEGDIVRYGKDEPYQIIFTKGMFTLDGRNAFSLATYNTACEIIGNIYENPELLNGENEVRNG